MPNSMNQNPPQSALSLTVRAVVRKSRKFVPETGPQAGHVFYSADAEISTPGMRWSTMRVKVSGDAPIPEGEQNLLITSFSDKDGTGLAKVF